MRRIVQPRGFTLVEVLATMLLMGILLPTLLEGVSLARRAGGEARHKVEAATLAESKENELIAIGQAQTGALSGDFADQGPEYREYHWTAQSAQFDANLPDLWQMTVRVSWTERAQERFVDVTTMVYTGVGSSATGSTTGSTGGASGARSNTGGGAGARTGGGGR
jgi:prepilin-type N-terminal cleavage/methylation domain-containing protein